MISIGQGFAWGPKGGLSLGQQSEQSYQKDILLAYHGALYMESLSEEDKYALFAQIGYHQRGSALRTQRFIVNGNIIPARTRKSTFNNIVLQLGGKQKFPLGDFSKFYFGVALRGEYNVSTDLSLIYRNQEDLVTKFVYGATASVGLQRMFSELVGVIVEFNVHPDFSDQIIVPAQRSFPDQTRIIPETRIRNITYELSLGFRFLRKVIYE